MKSEDAGGATVLCIVPDAYLADLLHYILARAGYAVRVIQNSTQMHLVVAADRPAIVLLDCDIPHADRVALRTYTRDILQAPVVLLSDRQVDGVRGVQQDADEWITKPFSCQVLLARLAMLLKRTQSSG